LSRHEGEFAWRFGSEPEIIDVETDSPADRAGVRPGDTLTHVDGIPITKDKAGQRFAAAEPGDSLEWTVERNGRSRRITVIAGENPERNGTWEMLRADLERAREDLSQYRLDDKQLDGLRQTEKRLADMARSLAELERKRAVLAPRALRISPEAVVITPSPHDDGVQIIDRRVVRDAHKLRYTGQIGDSSVEVRGTSAVVVTEEKNGDLVIDTPEASIRVRKKD
jgi:hypothetical protein